jgi:hypothetical protein
MKLILVASMAFAAYLVISADSGVITRNGRSVRRNGEYNSRSASPTSGLRTPTTTRSGFMKSSMAAPSFRNSGLLATSTCGHPFSARMSATRALVPTGTVDLVMTTREPGRPTGSLFSARAIALATAHTALRSASPASDCGVPTAMKMRRAAFSAVGRSVVNVSRPSLRFLPTSSASPGS